MRIFKADIYLDANTEFSKKYLFYRKMLGIRDSYLLFRVKFYLLFWLE